MEVFLDAEYGAMLKPAGAKRHDKYVMTTLSWLPTKLNVIKPFHPSVRPSDRPTTTRLTDRPFVRSPSCLSGYSPGHQPLARRRARSLGRGRPLTGQGSLPSFTKVYYRNVETNRRAAPRCLVCALGQA